MTRLSEQCVVVIVLALLERRRHLQERVQFWQQHDDHDGEKTATENLQRTEEAIVELDKRTVPWLHTHPECADLFTTTKIPAAASYNITKENA